MKRYPEHNDKGKLAVTFPEEMAVWIERRAKAGMVSEGQVVRICVKKAMERFPFDDEGGE